MVNTEKNFLVKIHSKGSKVFIRNVCNQKVIDLFREKKFKVDVIKEIQSDDKRYF